MSAAAEFGLRRVTVHGRQMWAIFRGDAQVSGLHTSKAVAEDCLENRRRKARITVRGCLLCGTSFKSEGPHNRMCPGCRSRGPSAEEVAV